MDIISVDMKTGLSLIKEGGVKQTVNWKTIFCTCPDFSRTHEICKHIRAVQDFIVAQRPKLTDEKKKEIEEEIARDFD